LRRRTEGRAAGLHFYIEVKETRLPPCSHDTRPHDLRNPERVTGPSGTVGQQGTAGLRGPCTPSDAAATGVPAWAAEAATPCSWRRRGVATHTVPP